MKLVEIKLRIGKTVIHPQEIIMIHAECGRTVVQYRESIADLPNADKVVKIEADTCDIELLME